jgi:hypothetical protein
MDEIEDLLGVDNVSEVPVEEELPTPINVVESDTLYLIKEIMNDHHLTLEQAFYLMCKINDIDHNISATDTVSLYNKGLLKNQMVNKTLLFHLHQGKQLTLDLPFSSEPKCTDYTADIADRIEKVFVHDKLLTPEYRKAVADKYFKGDLSLSRYFIIFQSLFPVKDKAKNSKFIYDGIGLWDSSPRVAKKFIEIYKKKDIGIFLEATYTKVKDSIDFELSKCFMTKPYKYLLAFDDAYDDAAERISARQQPTKTTTSTRMVVL